MKLVKKVVNSLQKRWIALSMIFLSKSVLAEDLLATALDGNIKDTLGSNSKFWMIFILIDIVLATAMAVKTKNPMTFASVFFVVFIPVLLMRTFVF